MKCNKLEFRWSCAPDPAGGAYSWGEGRVEGGRRQGEGKGFAGPMSNCFLCACLPFVHSMFYMPVAGDRPIDALDTAGGLMCSVRRCPAIFSPTSGVLTCDAANLYGSRCSVACIPGYSLHGQPAQTECLPDRQWSTDVPACRRKFTHLFCPAVRPGL